MSNVFEGTSVKQYASRYRKDNASPWEYTSAREYDTLEEAQDALSELASNYEIAEKSPILQYKPGGRTVSNSPLLKNVLEEAGFKPYMLQELTTRGEWENRRYLQFDTLEAAIYACHAYIRPHRVATATVDIQYTTVKVSGYE